MMGRYGISVDTYEHMQSTAAGICSICKEPDRELVVDHCHIRQGVRGLICRQCNLVLGYAYDNPRVLYAAAAYLIEKENFWRKNPEARHAVEVINNDSKR